MSAFNYPVACLRSVVLHTSRDCWNLNSNVDWRLSWQRGPQSTLHHSPATPLTAPKHVSGSHLAAWRASVWRECCVSAIMCTLFRTIKLYFKGRQRWTIVISKNICGHQPLSLSGEIPHKQVSFVPPSRVLFLPSYSWASYISVKLYSIIQ